MGLGRLQRFCFPHTVANKLTGFLLFLAVPTFFWTVIPVAVVAAVATFAAIQEGRVQGDGEPEKSRMYIHK